LLFLVGAVRSLAGRRRVLYDSPFKMRLIRMIMGLLQNAQICGPATAL
jgi:hypothetical protein